MDGRVLIVGGARTYNVALPEADPVSCLEILTDNNSELSNVGAAEYGSYPVGPALYCLR